MADKNGDSDWDTPDHKQSALLIQYQEVREEIRMTLRSWNRRITRGLAAIGLVIGYGLVSEEFVALSLVPVIIGFVFLLNLIDHRGILLLGRHAADIETELPYDTFSWESRYGEVVPDNERQVAGRWGQIPLYILVVIGATAYVIFILIAVGEVENAGFEPVLHTSVRIWLEWGYVSLTLLILAAFFGHWMEKHKIRNEICGDSDTQSEST